MGDPPVEQYEGQFPPDIWETAVDIVKAIDPDNLLADDPTVIIALMLKLEREFGPGPELFDDDLAQNYEGNA